MEMTLDQSSENLLKNDDFCSDMENFYNAQGCFYRFRYSKFDFETVKNLAKVIIGYHGIPPKSSFELFGDSLKFLYAEMGIDKPEKRRETVVAKKPEKSEPVIKKAIEEKDENKEEGRYTYRWLFSNAPI